MPRLKMTEVLLVHCNIDIDNYQHKSRVLYAFVPNKLFGHLLDISLKHFVVLKTFNSEFSCVEV